MCPPCHKTDPRTEPTGVAACRFSNGAIDESRPTSIGPSLLYDKIFNLTEYP